MGIPKLRRLEREDTTFTMAWSDGTEHRVSYDDLRHACPCANCAPKRNDEGTSVSLRRSVEAIPKERPAITTVGNYALQFEWTGGCSSGIYRFERLWALGQREDPDGGRPYVHGAW